MMRLRDDEARALVSSYGVPANPVRFAERGSDAGRIAVDVRRPVAIKLVARDVVHKSQSGGVLLDVAWRRAAEQAEELLSQHRERGGDALGVTVEPMVEPGIEVSVGGLHSDGYGRVVMFGRGGIHIEDWNDVAFGLAPLDRAQADALVARTQVGRSIAKRCPERLDELSDLILAVAGAEGILMREDIAELDINPVIVSDQRVIAVDARATRSRLPAGASAGVNTSSAWEDLRPAIYPESVAVVGASNDPSKMGNRVVRGMLDMGFSGAIFPLSRSSKTICGLPALAGIDELPRGVERAVVVTPADVVPTVLSELAGRGVRTAHVLTADAPPFTYPKGQRGGMRVLGPNCLGHYAPSVGITMISPTASSRVAGHVAVVSQSGTYAGDAVRRGAGLGLTYSFVTSVGNCEDVTPAELLAFCDADPATKVAGFYLEGDVGAGDFFRVARTVSLPVVLLRGGRTATGKAAAASHTGAMASDSRLLVDAAREAGVLLVDDADQFFDALVMLQHSPTIAGDGMALVGSGGGVGVVGADAAEGWALGFPVLGADSSKALAPYSAPGCSLSNPVDLPVWSMYAGDHCFTGELVEAVVLDDEVHAVCAFLDVGTVFDLEDRPGAEALMWRLTDGVIHADRRGRTLVLVLRNTLHDVQDDVIRRLRGLATEAGVATFDSVDRAVRAVGGVRWLTRAAEARAER
jgi:acyl-CoA synthetase (NDP forming)